MATLLMILGQTGLGQATPTTQPGGRPPVWYEMFFASPMGLMFLLIIVLWIFMLRGKKGQERKRQDMLSALKRGDRVQTIGGVVGTVMDIRDGDLVVVKVDEPNNTKMTFVRSAIHKVLDAASK